MRPRSLLDQIRSDLKGLDPNEQQRAEEAVGKSLRYFSQASAENLKLETIFALGRCLGYKPAEYLSRLLQASPTIQIQPGPIGLFRRLSRIASKSRCSKNLSSFLDWGYGVTVREGTGPSIDLQQRLSTLGIELSTGDTLEYADLLFSLYSRNGAGQLAGESIHSLVGSIALVIEILLKEDSLHEACRVLDLAFYLESLIQDLDLRQRLFEQAGRICLELKQPHHGVWCFREAAFLALLVPSYEQAQALHRRAVQIATDSGLDIIGGSKNQASETELGSKDLNLLLLIMTTDRRASSVTAAELDTHLGAQKAFTMAVKGRAPMSVGRWHRFIEALGVSPGLQLRRLDFLQAPTVPIGKFMQRLKVGNHDRRTFAWQTKLLSWCDEIEVSSKASRNEIFGGDAWAMPPEQAFEPVSQALGRFASNPLPKHLHPTDTTTLINGMLRIAHVLRLKSQLNDAADLVDTVFCLEERHPYAATQSMTYRSASALALYLGSLEVSVNLLNRAKMIDMAHWNPQGLLRTNLWEGLIAQLIASYEVSLRIHQAGLQSAQKFDGLPTWMFCSNMARTALLFGDIPEAGILLDRFVQERGPTNATEYLWTRGIYLSISGAETGAASLLEKAHQQLAISGRKTDLILIGLEKCRHSLRYEKREQARKQAKNLLSVIPDLGDDTIGREALLELIRGVFSGEGKLDSFQQVMRRIQLPNLESQDTISGSSQKALYFR